MPPALVALAPVVASAVGGIVKNKQQKSAEKKANEFGRRQAESEEAQNRSRFEASQNSPEAQQRRMGLNSRMASVLGQFGGRENTPGFILDSFDKARGPQQYTPGAEFIDKPGSGAGIWDVVGGAGEALSNFDVERFKKDKATRAADTAPVPNAPAPGGFALPSSFGKQDFKLGPTPAADEFLNQRRQ